MAVGQVNSVLRLIRTLAETEATRKIADGELLRRFLSERDEASFKALVRRHGALVFRICMRVLCNEQDAEDAFQATFLVLARKAGAVQRRGSVGSWLFGVAYRVSSDLRKNTTRRRIRERQLKEKPSTDPFAEMSVREALETLDCELALLPDKYRGPLILCCMEGLGREEAALQLGLSVTVVKSRLERARELLRERLARRGLTLPGVLLVATLYQHAASAAVATVLVDSTVKSASLVAAGSAATAVVSSRIAALAEGMVKAMMFAKLKYATAIVLVTTALGAWMGGVGYRALAGDEPGAAVKVAPPVQEERELRKQVDQLKEELTETRVERDLRARQAITTQRLADKLKEELAAARIDLQKAVNETRDPEQQVLQLQKELAATRKTLDKALQDLKAKKKKEENEPNLEAVWAIVSVKDNDKNPLDCDPIFSHAAGTQAPIRNSHLTLQAGKFTLKTGPVFLEGTYTLDPSVTPRKITLGIATDPGSLLSIPGVYSLDDDDLTITFDRLPASLVAGLAWKEPGVCYTLRRESLPKKDSDGSGAEFNFWIGLFR